MPQRIAAELEAEIRGGPPEAAFASEKALATRYGVSRVVIREAIARLKAQGLLRSESGKGHFTVARKVSPLVLPGLAAGEGDLTAMLHLIELRAAAETHAAALAARRRSAADLSAMEAALSGMAAAIESGDVDLGVKADLSFHRSIFEATGNPYFSTFAGAVTQPLLEIIRAARSRSAARPAQRWQAQEEHQQIFDAIRSGNARTARAAAQRHVDNTAKRLSSLYSSPTTDES